MALGTLVNDFLNFVNDLLMFSTLQAFIVILVCEKFNDTICCPPGCPLYNWYYDHTNLLGAESL